MEDLLPDAEAPWAIAAFQRPEPFPLQKNWLLARLSLPAPEVKLELEARGFTFLRSEAVSHRTANLTAAAAFIEAAPSLALAVRTHVRGISLLAADEAYDVTHSEPRWADWIFVSCPAVTDEVAALRTAENVVHEAMHLQLTKVEGQMNLVCDEGAFLDSPWKQEPRPLQGVLHGLYVFACIRGFFQKLDPVAISVEGSEYLDQRKREIDTEFELVDLRKLQSGLTADGRKFSARILL